MICSVVVPKLFVVSILGYSRILKKFQNCLFTARGVEAQELCCCPNFGLVCLDLVQADKTPRTTSIGLKIPASNNVQRLSSFSVFSNFCLLISAFTHNAFHQNFCLLHSNPCLLNFRSVFLETVFARAKIKKVVRASTQGGTQRATHRRGVMPQKRAFP